MESLQAGGALAGDAGVLMASRNRIEIKASLRFRLPHCDVEPPLVVPVIERNQRYEWLVERFVLLRLEQRIERRGSGVVPDQFSVANGRLGGMALEVAQAVVDAVADQAAEDRAACARPRTQDLEALRP